MTLITFSTSRTPASTVEGAAMNAETATKRLRKTTLLKEAIEKGKLVFVILETSVANWLMSEIVLMGIVVMQKSLFIVLWISYNLLERCIIV